MDKERRLSRLEGEDASQHEETPSRRSRPTDDEEKRALDQGWQSYYDLFSRYGWTREEVDEDLEWTAELIRRFDASGMEGWEIVKDQCDYVDSLNLPLDQRMDAFADYPGPYHWRGEGGL